jgi:hypothetical protein
MLGTQPRKQYRLGDLVVAAYDQTARTTRQPQAASRLAILKLTRWLERSDRKDLLHRTPPR